MMIPKRRVVFFVGCVAVLLTLAAATDVQAQEDFEPNYDEAKVPSYELPDPLRFSDGTAVESKEAWRQERRPQILRLFREHVYGRVPGQLDSMWAETVEQSDSALVGEATRQQVTIHLQNDGKTETLDVLLYLPSGADGPVPVFLGLNYYGNHTVYADPAIQLPDEWVENNAAFNIAAHRATSASRGMRNYRWPVRRLIIERGYGLATAYYGDIDSDRQGHWQDGVHSLFYEEDQTQPSPGEWGAIGAWAWGLSRIMDYLEQAPGVSKDCVAVMGHSRLGKAALWAGARDERFALTISNNSGAGGAALSRRHFGETVWRINTSFPHWFAGNFQQYNQNEDALPVDQHMLIALVAPRPVYVASAEEDLWADPHGEFLAAKGAEPVYELLGAGGLAAERWPPVGDPVLKSRIGYHVRPGGHNVTDYDWEMFTDFADRHLSCRP